jgi:hypothetical protein
MQSFRLGHSLSALNNCSYYHNKLSLKKKVNLHFAGAEHQLIPSCNHHVVLPWCGKNAEAAGNGHFFLKLVSVIQHSVAQARFACSAHQAVTMKAIVCFLMLFE